MNHTAMLYVSAYTAPDGTKRRPLVERIPECRPQIESPTMWLTAVVGDDDGEKEYTFWWTDICSPVVPATETVEDNRPMFDDEAAALLRCAVEDWLMDQCLPHGHDYCELMIKTRNGGWNGGRFIIEHSRTQSLFGETLHHALIAAAHAVADAQGIEA